MKKLVLCLIAAAFTAALHVEFRWEKTARTEWHEYALNVQSLP